MSKYQKQVDLLKSLKFKVVSLLILIISGKVMHVSSLLENPSNVIDIDI